MGTSVINMRNEDNKNENIIEVFTVVKTWVVIPCSVVDGYKRFGRTYYLQLLGEKKVGFNHVSYFHDAVCASAAHITHTK
jgi:hypothetical protein